MAGRSIWSTSAAVRCLRFSSILALGALLGAWWPAAGWSAQSAPADAFQQPPSQSACIILADSRLEGPLSAILAQYQTRTGTDLRLEFRKAAKLKRLLAEHTPPGDLVVWMEDEEGEFETLGRQAAARPVAWKYPTFQPVRAAALTAQTDAPRIVRFLGGAEAHRLWSESKAGFTIVPDRSAASYQWMVENRLAHTYPITARRMLAECGGIRRGTLIDVGCGTGQLAVELARLSDFTIIGLDINPDVQPLFEKTVRRAGLAERISFVLGDAQKMPFPDDSADVIVSRGTLIFIPNIAKSLREVDRVLKPTGVAFLGGRYLYAPQAHKISTERLRKIVRESGVERAQVVEQRGQWVKIVGPRAPEAAQHFQGGPQMLAGRLAVDYGITQGRCLLVHRGDGPLEQALQQGLVETTELEITALYPDAEAAQAAERRLREAKLSGRVQCLVGQIEKLPFPEASFHLVAGVGPVLIWSDRPRAIRELYRVLRPGGVAFVGGRYLGMPEMRRVSSDELRQSAAQSGAASVRVIDDMGQWVEIRKGVR